MARTKTTEMSTITAAQLADGDWFPVIDVSDTTTSPTGRNKKVAKSEMAEVAGLSAHLADATDAHDASAISFSATGNIAATDVQAAIAELDNEKAAVAEPIAAAHISDASAAHAASAVSFSATGSISSTDVQAAIAEVDSDLTAHTGDTSDAHDASAISVLDTAGNYTATDVEAVLAELPSRFRPLANLEVKPIKVMASPPTVGTKNVGSTGISSPQHKYTSVGLTATQSIDTSWWSSPGSGAWSVKGDTFPNYLYVESVKASTGRGSGYDRIEFYVDCTTFEIMHKGQAGHWRMWVDDELISETPVSVPNDGSVYFQPITFGSKAVRKITLDWYNIAFGGIVIGPTDSVWKAQNLRPKCLVIGDSLTEGSTAGAAVGWVMAMGASLGWDVTNGGQGASGYVTAGSYTGKFAQRIPYYANDDYDVVIFAGGINDTSQSATLQAEALACFQLAQATWPAAKIIATSPPWNKGVEGWGVGSPSPLNSKTLISNAASTAGITYIDVLEQPFDSTPKVGTVTSSASSGATSVSLDIRIPSGGVVQLGTDPTTAERRVVTASSGSGPFSHTVAALTSARAAGTVATHVGHCLFTGTGKVGATTGAGNCDLYIDTDGTHWTAAGHKAYGIAVAHQIARALRTAANAAA